MTSFTSRSKPPLIPPTDTHASPQPTAVDFLLQLIQPNLPVLEGSTTGQMSVVKFPLTTAPAPTPSENFNPAAMDISNSISLHRLKRPQLNQVCFYHQLSAGGTNAAIIACLIQRGSRKPLPFLPTMSST